MENIYEWTDNPTVSGLSVCDTDVLNDCLMHLKYEHGGGNPYSLLQPVWSDKKLNNVSWLISQGQANIGIVYQSVYELLQSEYESGYEETENICGVTITYHLSEKGYKITTDKDSYDRLYVLTGTSWFYVLDEENTEFYLPRTNGFMQFGSVGGQFNRAGLPNITGSFTAYNDGADNTSGCVTQKNNSLGNVAYQAYNQLKTFDIDASNSNSIYGSSNTVQPNAVTGYLYFYVGDTVRNRSLIDVATIAEGLANKADISMLNARTERYVIEKSDPSLLPSWYTVYSDGWIEQGGSLMNITMNTWHSITFLKPFADTNYSVLTGGQDPSISTSYPDQIPACSTKTTTGMRVGLRYLSGGGVYPDRGLYWKVFGYGE